MKKRLTNNIGLKILALLASIILWLIVVNINDPEVTKTYEGIEVEILNTDAVTNDGKTFEILENSNYINVTITAKKSVMSALGKENIHATADMSQLTFMNTVGINVTTDRSNNDIENIKLSSVNLKLSIEDIARKQLVINMKTSGKPGEGYITGDVRSDRNIVQLSGPKSVIDSIVSAEAVADITGMTSDISTSAEIRLYDADGKQIRSSSVVKNINAINVTVEILGTKRVPLKYEIMGTPVNGYALTGQVTSTPESVMIAGKPSTLAGIKEISIPETAVNVTGQSSDMTVIVDVNKYLPDGIMLADSAFNGKATIVVSIEKEKSVTAEITAKSISITNIPRGYDVSIVEFEEPVTVTLIGIPEDIEKINTSSLTGMINMTTVMENLGITQLETDHYYSVPVTFSIPVNVRTSVDEFVVSIYVTEK